MPLILLVMQYVTNLLLQYFIIYFILVGSELMYTYGADVRLWLDSGPNAHVHGKDYVEGEPFTSVRDGVEHAVLHHLHGVDTCADD